MKVLQYVIFEHFWKKNSVFVFLESYHSILFRSKKKGFDSHEYAKIATIFRVGHGVHGPMRYARKAPMLLSQVLAKLRRWVEDAPEDRKKLAGSLGVSERTLTNWLTRPDDHPIPLAKTLGLCEILKVPPARLLSSAVEIWERLADPVGAEQRLLELEREIPPGGVKRIIYPLFPPPLMTDVMVQRYATAGAYRRFFPDKERNKMVGNVFEAFLAIRRQRRAHFETSNHIIRLLLMRNEFEAWLNGERLFEEVSATAKIEQLDYLIYALRDLTWNGQPRLVLRMTSTVFRMQYSLFPHPLVLLSGNSGFLFLEEPNILMFLEQEYSAMWEENTFPALRHPDAWLALLEMAKAHLKHVPPGKLPSEQSFKVRTALDKLAMEWPADT